MIRSRIWGKFCDVHHKLRMKNVIYYTKMVCFFLLGMITPFNMHGNARVKMNEIPGTPYLGLAQK
jgi:hypothetical protein